MGLFEGLRDGALGVEMVFPSAFEAVKREETSFQLAGAQAGVGWWVLFFPGITLDLSDVVWPSLQRDVERQTRALFEQMFRTRELTPERQSRGPRTSDPKWSPVIEIERLSIDGGPAFHVLHRMAYEPGWEVLMGHFLVPSEEGLFEARWVTSAQLTGVRESMWLASSDLAPDSDESWHPGQAAFDDPELDLDFPDHPLSVARQARRWLASDVRARVRRPFRPVERAAIELPSIGYALVPPRRFAAPSTVPGPRGKPWVSMNRSSFSGSDGIDWLFVQTVPAPMRLPWGSVERRLGSELETIGRAAYAGGGVERLRSSIVTTGSTNGRPRASVLVEGDGHQGPLRMVVRGAVHDGRIVALFLTTSATLSVDEMLAEVEASAETLRRL